MKKISIISIVLATIILLILVGCGGSSSGSNDDSGSGTETETLNSRVTGVWQFSSGSRFTELDLETLQYIQFNADGTGLMVFESEFGILDNQTIIYVVVNDNTVTINSDTMYRMDNTYLFTKPDDSTLTLIDASANEISFSLQSEIPANLLMKSFTAITPYRDLEVEPNSSTNLVWDGTYLWYEEAGYTDLIYPFDLTTEALLTGLSVDLSLAGQYTHIQAYQGGDFWSHCNCGGNQAVQRRNPGAPFVLVDDVDTDTDLSHEIGVRGVAWDGSYLWLSGYSSDEENSFFLKVDSDLEPDNLEAAYNYDRIKTMTWDGTYFWAISSSEKAVIQIDPDPAGFTTVATYESPDTFLDLIGIASVGSDLYLLGRDYSAGIDKKGVIFKVTP